MAIKKKAVDELVRRIVDLVHPLRIILFGSAARGDARPGSDIDLLVVVSERRTCGSVEERLYRELRGVGVPFDILVITPSRLERHKNNIGLIYRTILAEGREVYAA